MLGAGLQSVLLCRLLNTGCALHNVRLPPLDMCYSISGVRQTDTSVVVLAGIVVYVVVVWHLVGGGLTSNSRAKSSRNPTGSLK